jgi:hypothetical protein
VGGMIGTGLGVATALWECTPGRRFRNGERGDGVASYSGGGGMSMVERLMHQMCKEQCCDRRIGQRGMFANCAVVGRKGSLS